MSQNEKKKKKKKKHGVVFQIMSKMSCDYLFDFLNMLKSEKI